MIYYNEFEMNAAYILIKGGKYKYSVTGEEAEVSDLYFAKYLITNKLYSRFIETLSPDNREKFQSPVLYNKRFNGNDQPVVGISWYAAKTYCDWLTKQINDGFTYRLPTEQEWEWAASGGKRKYPWGDEEPDETRANYGGNVWKTTPVGAYPAGATPDGLMDMAGNVWEWMSNWYGKDEEWRALRGGSWFFSIGDLSCTARSGGHSVNQWGLSGFRVVAVQSSF